MSNIVQTQQQPVTIQAKSEVEYTPFGSDDKIKLSLAIVKNYIAVPTREKELPDERDCMRFLMLCRSRRLDPFTGDAYMIGFKKQGAEKAEWSLITSQSAFMKRAEIHPEFDGLESGVIVRDSEDRLVEREGDFLWNGDELLGGWASVHFKNRKFPMRKKVQLNVYRKNFGVWVTDPAGMICKVAEVHALRDAFPTMLGGMLLREEATEITAEVLQSHEVRRPEFAKGLPAPDLKEQPNTQPGKVRTNENPPRATPKTAQDAPGRVNTPTGAQTPAQSPAASEIPPSGGSEGPSDEELEAAAGLAPSRTETQPQTTTSAAGATSPSPDKGGAPAPESNAPVATSSRVKGDPNLFKPKEGEGIPLTSVRRWLHTEGVTEPELLRVLVANKAAKAGQKLGELSEAKLDNVYKARATLLTQITQQPANA